MSPTGKIIITTSRRPRPRSRTLVKDLVSVIPGCIRVTRGHSSYVDLAREALRLEVDRVVIIGERRGNPGIIRVYEPTSDMKLRNIVTFLIIGVKLSREARTSKPINPTILLVEPDGSSVAEEFSEALIRAFHAKLMSSGDLRDVVIAKLERLSEDSVLLTFHWRGRQVGPILKLRKPRVMVKG